MQDIIYPLAKETINKKDVGELIKWLKTNPRLTKGELTLEFEKQWAEYIGTKYAVFVNSGSSANLLATYVLKELNNLKGKKVIVPSVGWVTTIAPVMQFGFEPIMVDADPKTYGLNLQQVEDICSKEDIAAVILVQVLGIPHSKEILKLKEKYGFTLIEDGCAALGARYMDGSKVGTVGNMSTFSFYFGHQLSTIEGGMINTDDDELYKLLLILRSHGWGRDLKKTQWDSLLRENNIDQFHKYFTFFNPGFNLRATDLQAFIGLNQLKKADKITELRNRNHIKYAKLLRKSVEYQDWGEDYPVSISFGALLNHKSHREKVVHALRDNGIETRVFSSGNLGLQPFWKKEYGEFHGRMADRIHECGIFLPNYPELKLKDISFICDIVKNA